MHCSLKDFLVFHKVIEGVRETIFPTHFRSNHICNAISLIVIFKQKLFDHQKGKNQCLIDDYTLVTLSIFVNLPIFTCMYLEIETLTL